MVDYLVCEPEYFNVSYAINSYMEPQYWDKKYELTAQEQWKKYTNQLQKVGADIVRMPAVKGLPDLVFTANGAVVLNKIALLARFRHPQRQVEEPYFLAMFESMMRTGLIKEIHQTPKDVIFEGAGDCLWDPYRKKFWMGYGQRSDSAAIDLVEKTFGYEVTPLELVSPHFYHLDTCFVPLSGGELMVHMDAFSSDTQRFISQCGPTVVSDDISDANSFAFNAVCFEKNIIISRCSPELELKLYDIGYDIHKSPLDIFLKSGGAAACLQLRLNYHG